MLEIYLGQLRFVQTFLNAYLESNSKWTQMRFQNLFACVALISASVSYASPVGIYDAGLGGPPDTTITIVESGGEYVATYSGGCNGVPAKKADGKAIATEVKDKHILRLNFLKFADLPGCAQKPEQFLPVDLLNQRPNNIWEVLDGPAWMPLLWVKRK